MQKKTKTVLFSSVFIGVALGLMMAGFAWQHNAGCSIHCNNFINWSALFSYGAFGAVTSAGAFALIVHR